MRIAFYAPFKPLDHPRPSGDQTTARALAAYLAGRGHQVFAASSLRTRHIWAKPWLWGRALAERARLSGQDKDLRLSAHDKDARLPESDEDLRLSEPDKDARLSGQDKDLRLPESDEDLRLSEQDKDLRLCGQGKDIRVAGRSIDAWLTCHAYYKAPDVLGPAVTARLGIPYVVFQGIYSTKRRKNPLTWPGFMLNRAGLLAADAVFANRRLDLDNLRRLLPEERLGYCPPGIDPAPFAFDHEGRKRLRLAWGAGDTPVVLAVAMMRKDVKAHSLHYLLERLAACAAQGLSFRLVLAGDGPARPALEAKARTLIAGRALFLGQVPRRELGAVYSAADVFAFPGIRESLGMVYLEAQAAGLAVAALDNGGVAEVVRHGQTGFLTPPADHKAYEDALSRLVLHPEERRTMGQAGAAMVRRHHDAGRNFAVVEERLLNLTQCPPAGRACPEAPSAGRARPDGPAANRLRAEDPAGEHLPAVNATANEAK